MLSNHSNHTVGLFSFISLFHLSFDSAKVGSEILTFLFFFPSRNAEYLAIASESKDNCAGVQVGE